MATILMESAAAAAAAARRISREDEIGEPRPVTAGHMENGQWIEEDRTVTYGGVPLARVVVDSRSVSPVTGAVRHTPLGIEFPATRVPTRAEFLAAAPATDEEGLSL